MKTIHYFQTPKKNFCVFANPSIDLKFYTSLRDNLPSEEDLALHLNSLYHRMICTKSD
jgi:hypothetical protein